MEQVPKNHEYETTRDDIIECKKLETNLSGYTICERALIKVYADL